jgi:hypothetical protein
MVYPALLPLMRTTRLLVVDWTDAPSWFRGTRPFRRKTKSGFCACVVTFQTQSNYVSGQLAGSIFRMKSQDEGSRNSIHKGTQYEALEHQVKHKTSVTFYAFMSFYVTQSVIWLIADLLNPLNVQLNPICHLLALLGAHHILHVNRIRVKCKFNEIFLLNF